jgi:alanine dehydrogenase
MSNNGFFAIGVPRETKAGEHRVGLMPADVATLAQAGHRLRVEAGAGEGAGHGDADYRQAGAEVVTAQSAWSAALIVKVKEVQPDEVMRVGRGQALFGFQHLVGDPGRTRLLASREATVIAYEMVRDASGEFPLLAPMSRIAGRMAVDVAVRTLGRMPAKVLVLGAGHAGLEAAKAARAAGAEAIVLSRTASAMAQAATPQAIERHALDADLVVGAVFISGAPTPRLLPRALVARMKRGAMIVDISIDAGGVAETSRPTTHANPVYVEEGVIHYCVANMPAADPRASTAALSAAALPYVHLLAAGGIAPAVRDHAALRSGVLLWRGRVNHRGIAEEAGLPYTPLSDTDLPPR